MIRVNAFVEGREQKRSLMEMISCDLMYSEKCHELIRIQPAERSPLQIQFQLKLSCNCL